MSKVMNKAAVDKARTARHLLPDPGPEVVGDFIATLDKLREYAKHKDGCRMGHAAPDQDSGCSCGLKEYFGDPKVIVDFSFHVMPDTEDSK